MSERSELLEELKLLEDENKKNLLTTDMKKLAFIEELKTGIGPQIKETINNPDRHNPKKMSLWDKFKKSIGY